MDAPLSALAPLVQVEGLRHVYRQGEGNVLILDGVDLTLQDKEIVGLLGRSGSGKSTMLRIIAGLMPPTAGIVAIDGEPVRGPASQVAMVFQTFALFPWLTVLDNVEIGLEAQGMPAAERHKRALAAIDLIGLDGYESAFPKELSGGTPACRVRPRAGRAPEGAVDGRALLRARCADCRDPAHRFARPVERGTHADPLDPDGDSQYRRGGAHVRPHPGVFLEPRPRRRGHQGGPAAAAQPARSGLPPARRRYLRQHDRKADRQVGPRWRVSRNRIRHVVAARFTQCACRADRDGGRGTLQRPRRSPASGGQAA